MDLKTLFIVKGTFYIRNKGLDINGDIDSNDSIISIGSKIVIKTPDGLELNATICGFNFSTLKDKTNLSILLNPEITENSVPIGSVVKLI